MAASNGAHHLMAFPTRVCTVVLMVLSSSAYATLTCELNGVSVNPNNGAETAGKSGLMRCKDADSGAPQREQELQNGRFMGVVRYFTAGQVTKEQRVNERGNQDGPAREWVVDKSSGRRTLVREGDYRNGDSVGTSRTWNPAGQLIRLTSYDDTTHREQAVVEFTADGRLADLRCAARPVFGSDFDDRAACGHAGAASTVLLYDNGGRPRTRLVVERGERRRTENLWDNGAVRDLRELTTTGLLERRFAADGTKRHEAVWVDLPAANANARKERVQTLDQDFHESGQLVSERRWRIAGRDAALESESSWYLQWPAERADRLCRSRRPAPASRDRASTTTAARLSTAPGRPMPAVSTATASDRPTGVHKTWDPQGTLRGEELYDERGRLTREREFDAQGTLVRDDEVFEDGSRKSPGGKLPARAASA